MLPSTAEIPALAADLRNALCCGDWDSVDTLAAAMASLEVPHDPGEAVIFIDVFQYALEGLRSVRARDIGLQRRVRIAGRFSHSGSGLDQDRQIYAEVTCS